jgi:hypothetical protein
MTHKLLARLQKLETQIPPQPTAKDKHAAYCTQVIIFGIAFYLGNPSPDEAYPIAYARGLGYPTFLEFRNAADMKISSLREKHASAAWKLMAKFGVSQTAEGEAIIKALERIEGGLSESYKTLLHQRGGELA